MLDVLRRRYRVDLPSLSIREAITYEARIDAKSLFRLRPLVEFCHALGSVITFAMFDPVCVLVFLSIHILRLKHDSNKRGGGFPVEPHFFLYKDTQVLCEVFHHFSCILRLDLP